MINIQIENKINCNNNIVLISGWKLLYKYTSSIILIIEPILKINEDNPNPATILGASPRHIYEINIDMSRSNVEIANKIIAVIVPSDNLWSW